MPNVNALSQWLNRAPFHYAWVIVGILALVQMVALSINFAGGVLVGPLTDPDGDFGFSFSNIGFSFGLYFLSSAMLAPVAGWLGDRYGPRNMMILGAVSYLLRTGAGGVHQRTVASVAGFRHISRRGSGDIHGTADGSGVGMVPPTAWAWHGRTLGGGRHRARANVTAADQSRGEPALAEQPLSI